MNLLLLCLLVVACVGEEDSEFQNDIEDTEDFAAEDRAGGGKPGYGYIKTKFVDPSLWKYVFAPSCDGMSQSPIDLITADAESIDCAPLTFFRYNKKPKEMTITNNGHTAVVTIDMTTMPTVSGGCLMHTYTFAQMHWHWGKKDNRGSEHHIDGKRYPLELHLVHFNSDDYDTIDDAIASGDPDALAVLGVKVQVGNMCKACSNPYHAVAKKLKKIKKADTSKKMKPLKLDEFLPANMEFFRYMGSLTTPNCNEIVRWTVFTTPKKINKDDLHNFRKLRDSYGNKLVDNYRPIQDLNGRTIQKH